MRGPGSHRIRQICHLTILCYLLRPTALADALTQGQHLQRQAPLNTAMANSDNINPQQKSGTAVTCFCFCFGPGFP